MKEPWKKGKTMIWLGEYEQTEVPAENKKEASVEENEEESGEEDDTDRSRIAINDGYRLDGTEFGKKEKEAYARVKEEWKELTHYQRCIRLPSVPLQEQWQMTQDEAFDLDQDKFRDKTSTGLRNCINEYYPEHVDAIYSATLMLTPQKVCNLVYQSDRFAAWIADLNLKTHDELEQEK